MPKIFYTDKNNKISNIEITIIDFLRFSSLSKIDQNEEINSIKQMYNFSMGDDVEKQLKNVNKKPVRVSRKKRTGNICKQEAIIDPKSKKELINLVNNAGKTKKDGSFDYHEIGGLLSLTKKGDKYVISTVKSSYMSGNNNGTNVPAGKAGFHTHPSREYVRQKVSYAWPSGDDYNSILEKMIKEDCILHIVATKEGTYCISFSPELARLSKVAWKKMFKENKTKTYKFQLPGLNDTISTPDKYIKKLKNMKIFTVEFRYWKDLKPFTFYYPKGINGSCSVK